MAEAVIDGMLTVGVTSSSELYATDILPERCAHLKTRYGIRVGGDNADAAAWGASSSSRSNLRFLTACLIKLVFLYRMRA